MKPWASFDLIPRSHSENREGLGERKGRGTFARTSVMSRRIQMAETIRGHSVDVLISRQKLITRRVIRSGMPVDLCL